MEWSEPDISGPESDVDEQHTIEYTQEDWQDLNSEHLLNMWMSIQSYLDMYYLKQDYLQSATFNNFCEFVYKFSV